MVAAGLWEPGNRRKAATHRSWRLRRSRYGDLIQFDGSYEWWLEDRYPEKLCLLAAIDDATGTVLDAAFDRHEGILPVMGFWSGYFKQYGVPKALYLDKFSTYSMNNPDAKDNPETLTQFERAAKELGMEIIHAHSPQAKGRVERLFRTLQDRLIKELRLHKVRTPEEANIFLKKHFLQTFNKKFGKAAAEEGDLHRKLLKREEEALPLILCRRESRSLRNDFTIPVRHVWYQILPTPRVSLRPKDEVLVHESPDGSIRLLVHGKDVLFKEIIERRTWARHPVRPSLLAA